jgi:carboxyl-terminal processing protease
MVHADSIKFPDSLRYFTQNKRVVYGGGGVMPDYFIPQDTSFLSRYYEDIFRKGLLNEFTVQYIETKRKDLLQTYPDLASFKKGFGNDKQLLDEFVAFAETKEVPRKEKDLEVSGSQIQTVLKALIARNLYNLNGYFEVIGSSDDDLIKAIEVIKNDAMFKKLSQLK